MINWVVLIFVLFKMVDAGAENSLLVSAYTQLSGMRFCGEVNKSDLQAAGFNCAKENIFEKVNESAAQIFEWNVFQLAAESQLSKNKCLAEQIEFILKEKNEESELWRSYMVMAYLGKKKAELILDKCNKEILSQVTSSEVEKIGVIEAYKKSRRLFRLGKKQPEINEEWLKQCADLESIESLKLASTIFQYSLPVVSHPNFFKEMEANRQQLISVKTNKPITDEELITSDLRHPLVYLPDFNDGLRQNLLKLAEERKQVTKKIQISKNKNGYDLDTDLRDYIYEDDTLASVMRSKGFIKEGYSGLGDTPSKDVSNGAFCMLSKFEPNMKGELAGFVAEAAAFGGVLFKMKQGLQALSYLDRYPYMRASVRSLPRSSSELLASSMRLGALTTNFKFIYKQVVKSCPVSTVLGGQKSYPMQKLMKAAQTEKNVFERAKFLPDSYSYKPPKNIKFHPKETPSCNRVDDKEALNMLNQMYQSNCIIDVLLTVTHPKYALPASLFLHH